MMEHIIEKFFLVEDNNATGKNKYICTCFWPLKMQCSAKHGHAMIYRENFFDFCFNFAKQRRCMAPIVFLLLAPLEGGIC
jgi:hypothetical protein